MRFRDLARVGHWPSLVGALFHFETSFAVWVLLGVLGPFIARDFHLSRSVRGLVVGTPLLAGAGFRIILGWLADRYGARRVGTASMLVVLLPLTWGWLAAGSLSELLAIGVLLGVAGASFAVALPLASSHYPATHQGLALGIAGAGNSGTIVAALVAPRVAERVGWHATLGLAAVPVVLMSALFWLMARDAPGARSRRPLRDAFAPLREPDCWRLCGMYAITFGGYVGLASYLPTLLVDRYGVSRVAAGAIAAAAAGAGSLLRPVGGLLADRVGGTRVLAGVYLAAAGLALGVSTLPALGVTAGLFAALLGTLGAGNGAVFQLVPLRFRGTVGLATGIIGAAGGVGGFLLPTVFGSLRQTTGSYRLGLWLLGTAAAVGLLSVVSIRLAWRRRAYEETFGEAVI